MDFNAILNSIGEIVNNLLVFIFSILPDSPFRSLESLGIIPYLGIINYFLPIDFFIDLTSAWVSAILIYYGLTVLMRWAKVIK